MAFAIIWSPAGRVPHVRMAALGALAVVLAGCSVRPQDAVGAFCAALERRDVAAARQFCTAALDARMTNAPSAARVFRHMTQQVTCKVLDLQRTPEGMRAYIGVVCEHPELPPGRLTAQLVLHLVLRDGRWMVDGGEVQVPQFVEFTANQESVDQQAVLSMNGQLWMRETVVQEPLAAFVQRCDRQYRLLGQ